MYLINLKSVSTFFFSLQQCSFQVCIVFLQIYFPIILILIFNFFYRMKINYHKATQLAVLQMPKSQVQVKCLLLNLLLNCQILQLQMSLKMKVSKIDLIKFTDFFISILSNFGINTYFPRLFNLP